MTTKTPSRRRKHLPVIASKKTGLSAGSIGLIGAGAFVAAAAGGAGLFVATQRRRPSVGRLVLDAITKPPALIGLGAAAGIALFRWQMARLFSEHATYDVETRVGPDDVEIRHYSPQIVAETTVHAENFREALDLGFSVLAEYIFGHNATGERIEMTAPVTQTREKLSDLHLNEDGTYQVRFTMPETFTMAELPAPLNHQVHLRALPARRVAALRYAGTFNGEDTEQMQLRLLANLKTQGLKPAGEAGFAGYDAPSTLPFLRRNEAWVELA